MREGLTVNQRHAWTILASLADPLKIAIKELITTDLETFFNHLGSILVRAILGSKSKNVVNCPATIRRRSMLTDVLNAPIAELSVGDDIDASEYFIDAGTL